jgi:hypothetical protein
MSCSLQATVFSTIEARLFPSGLSVRRRLQQSTRSRREASSHPHKISSIIPPHTHFIGSGVAFAAHWCRGDET